MAISLVAEKRRRKISRTCDKNLDGAFAASEMFTLNVSRETISCNSIRRRTYANPCKDWLFHISSPSCISAWLASGLG